MKVTLIVLRWIATIDLDIKFINTYDNLFWKIKKIEVIYDFAIL